MSMTSDTLLGYIGIGISTAFGIASVWVGVYGISDGRREHNRREKAVNAVHAIIGRTEGLLIGLKPSFSTNPTATKAADDGLDAVKIAKTEIQGL